MLRTYLDKLLAGQDLSAAETGVMLQEMVSDRASSFQTGAVLSAMRMKGESVSELVGGAELLRRNARFIDCGGRDCVDIVGTGGDGGKSFNISTTSALVAAGAGVNVAKHGSSAVSGRSGASDLLAALGYNLDAAPERIEQSIAEHGIGLLFAKKLHPLMGRAAPLRRELGIRTIFNLLGPLANPAGVRRMVVGVYSDELTELYAAALKELGVLRALVVHGGDGLDEITCCASTRVTELDHGRMKTYDLYPELLLGTDYAPEEIAGGSPQENAEITRRILSGADHTGARAVTVLNAAAACFVAGLTDSIRDAVPLAENAIDSGKAMDKLELLIRESRA